MFPPSQPNPGAGTSRGDLEPSLIDLEEGDKAIAERIVEFLRESTKQPKPQVSGWSQVVNMYAAHLYEGR